MNLQGIRHKARRLALAVLLIYGVLFGTSLIYSLFAGLKLSASGPLLLISEPWSSLIGFVFVYVCHGFMTNEYWDKLNGAGVAIVTASGCINMILIWTVAQLFKESK